MTRDEFLAALRRMAERDIEDRSAPMTNYRNVEADHIWADAVLLELLGDAEITEAFNEIIRWYS